jgi:hypothetical protein
MQRGRTDQPGGKPGRGELPAPDRWDLIGMTVGLGGAGMLGRGNHGQVATPALSLDATEQ